MHPSTHPPIRDGVTGAAAPAGKPSLPGLSLQLFRGDPEVFPGQLREEEARFGRLYPPSCSFGHSPKLLPEPEKALHLPPASDSPGSEVTD